MLPKNNINQIVVDIQTRDGVDVGPAWWEANVSSKVGAGATEKEMLDCFMAAYERDFPRGADGSRHPRDESQPGA
jgi:hypothetical protein